MHLTLVIIFIAIVLVHFYDITKRERERIRLEREAEKDLELKKQAQKIAWTKSEFLANMSHDIRIPMNTIMGFVDILKTTRIDDQQRKYLETITVSGQHLLELVDSILDLSKIESGQIKLGLVDFNLEYLIIDVFKITGIKLKGKSVQLYSDFKEGVPRDLKGDPTKLRQILINLLGNAIKFTEEGEIKVTVSLEENLSEREDDKQRRDGSVLLRFSVKDTGIGISDDKKESIFQSFDQGDENTEYQFGGTGLGLAICKSYVRAMGGEIWVDSEKTKGSEFIFTAQFAKGVPIVKKEIHPLSKEELKGKRVFIVDDEEKEGELMSSLCSSIGLDVFPILLCADIALDQLAITVKRGDPLPDILLIDIKLPDMKGLALASKIQEKEEYKDIKIVAVASDVRVGIALQAEEMAIDGFLPKPIKRNELFNVLSTVLGVRDTEGHIVTRHMARELACKDIKVLVVEDSIANQELIKAYFDSIGCQGDYALNGQEAIEKIKRRDYDLCLMDMQMPGMDGMEATKIIRNEYNKKIPIIALTAAAMEEDREKCIEAGMNDYLAKPIDILKLKEKIIQYVKPEIMGES